MIFDSHAHYDDEAFNEDREAILNSLPKNGISPIVNVSAQLSGVTATVELTEKYPFIYGSVAFIRTMWESFPRKKSSG